MSRRLAFSFLKKGTTGSLAPTAQHGNGPPTREGTIL